MSEVIVVPTFNRQALLHLCLEFIRKQEPKTPLRVFCDRLEHENYGNTANALEALSAGCTRADIVHYIEDDVIVHPGYFEWARKTLGEGYAAVCGRMPSEHYENWYSAPCASWNSNCLLEALKLVPLEYLEAKTQEEMRVIVDEQLFPQSKYYRCYTPEHDGFLCRAIEKFEWKTAFPEKPLCTHLGIGGYNRPPGDPIPTGSFDEQVSFYRALLADRSRREQLFGKHITDLEMSSWDASLKLTIQNESE